MSKIEWTDETWNPLAGCSPVSEGCRNCYAARSAVRMAGNPNPKVSGPYEGTARMTSPGPNRRAVFTGRVNLIPERLNEPLRWRKPRRVFVNSMSDLFHEDVPDEFIAEVFGVMAYASWHTYQILTKRPERAARFTTALRAEAPDSWDTGMRHVWLGTSVEDQAAADERIPHLLRVPAAVRFLSCEPLLGPVEFSDVTHRSDCVSVLGKPALKGIHWVIIGGESGPGARPCDTDWIVGILRQCSEAGVAVFVKQLGSRPLVHPYLDSPPVPADPPPRDRKGGDWSEWPPWLRVREWPA